jgi:biopolymer transport protein ExbB/TolQ
MDTNRAYIGAAILIAIVVFSNLILYGIARSISRNTRDINYMKTMQNLVRNTSKKQDAPLEELRKRVEELESKKKEDEL